MPFVEPGLVLGGSDSAVYAVTLSSSAAATARSRFPPRGWCAAAVNREGHGKSAVETKEIECHDDSADWLARGIVSNCQL